MFSDSPSTQSFLDKARNFENRGQFSQAERTYLEAIANDPEDYVLFSRLGALLVTMGRFKEALLRFEQARDLEEDDPLIWFNSALAHQAANDFETAIRLFEIAQKKGFDKGKIFGSMAEIYEQTNRLEELKSLIEKALRETPEDVFLLFNAAKLARREENYKKALDFLDLAEKQSDFEEIEIIANFEKGRNWDKLNQPDKAFQAFQKANLLTVTEGKFFGLDKKGYQDKIKEYSGLNLEKHFKRKTGSESTPENTPIFLVGFPRSGTTLLHQILEGHPSLDIVEEEPLISNLRESLFQKYGSLDQAFAAPSKEDWGLFTKDLVTIYKGKKEKGKGARIIDKLPLNILDIPLIYKLFPNAKIIVVLRHPFDCTLSCFMQNFELNSAMLNFTNLDDSTKLYADVFGLWQKYEKHFKPDFIYLRYEDLISDLEKETRKVISFLGLDWSPEVLKYRDKALSKTRIRTPSYHQVIRPIYKDSVDRWRLYEKFFKPFKKRLIPFCEAFGYDHQPKAKK